jgi:hypothetical protein
MLSYKDRDAGVAGRALNEAAAVLVVTQQEFRRWRGAVAVGAADALHSRISR